MDSIVTWMVSLMISMAVPLGPSETEAMRQERYRDIAADVTAVVYNPHQAPLYAGPFGRAKTAALVLAIMSFESDYRAEVDNGTVRGDNGKSWCLGQVKLGKPNQFKSTRLHIYVDPKGYYGLTKNRKIGWSGQDLVQDRTKCIRAMIAVAHTSFHVAKKHHQKHDYWLNLYASGKWNWGADASKDRAGLAAKWWSTMTPEVRDETVLAKLQDHRLQKEALLYVPIGAQLRTPSL